MSRLDQMFETFKGQMRNALPDSEVEELDFTRDEQEGYMLLDVSNPQSRIGSYRFLLIAAGNVKVCKGFWRFKGDLKHIDAVVVFYGFSQEQGATAECEGNHFKDDYRRIASTINVWKLTKHIYGEIPWRFTEENLKRLFTGQDLV